MSDLSHEKRLTSLEVRVSNVEAQTERSRRRLHDLENDRASVRALAKTVEQLVDNIESMAQRTAEVTIEKWWDQRRQRARESWKFRLLWLTSGASVVGTAGAIVVLIQQYG